MTLLWRLFKLALSVSLMAGAMFMLWLGLVRHFEPWILMFFSILCFFAALPWVDVLQPSRALGLTGIMLSFGLLGVAAADVVHPRPFPLTCSVRSLMCHLQNLLHALGGRPLAAAPFFVLGGMLLLGSVRLTWVHLRTPGSLKG